MSTDTKQHQATGLFVRVYLPSMADDVLTELSGWSLKLIDVAPRLGNWLAGVVSDEQLRRLQPSKGLESDAVLLPVQSWTNADMADALDAINALSFSTSSYGVGLFVDKLVAAINGAASYRLRGKQ